jgi:hypothetical protein
MFSDYKYLWKNKATACTSLQKEKAITTAKDAQLLAQRHRSFKDTSEVAK